MSEVLGELVTRLDDIARSSGVDRIDGDLGAEPGVLGDVRGRRNPSPDVGRQLARDLANGVEQLRPSSPADGTPVDEIIDCGNRRGGKRTVIEVGLVPVEPADGRVRAGVERLVEEGGVQRQRHQGVDAEGRERSAERCQVGEGRHRRLAFPEGVGSGEDGRTSGERR